jgi:hypothetical protein
LNRVRSRCGNFTESTQEPYTTPHNCQRPPLWLVCCGAHFLAGMGRLVEHAKATGGRLRCGHFETPCLAKRDKNFGVASSSQRVSAVLFVFAKLLDYAKVLQLWESFLRLSNFDRADCGRIAGVPCMRTLPTGSSGHDVHERFFSCQPEQVHSICCTSVRILSRCSAYLGTVIGDIQRRSS